MLDVLEINNCRHCSLIIELVTGVGWVHVPPRPVAFDWRACTGAVPAWLRCAVCNTPAPSTEAGLIRPHVGGSCLPDRLCSGVDRPGIPPRGWEYP